MTQAGREEPPRPPPKPQPQQQRPPPRPSPTLLPRFTPRRGINLSSLVVPILDAPWNYSLLLLQNAQSLSIPVNHPRTVRRLITGRTTSRLRSTAAARSSSAASGTACLRSLGSATAARSKSRGGRRWRRLWMASGAEAAASSPPHPGLETWFASHGGARCTVRRAAAMTVALPPPLRAQRPRRYLAEECDSIAALQCLLDDQSGARAASRTGSIRAASTSLWPCSWRIISLHPDACSGRVARQRSKADADR